MKFLTGFLIVAGCMFMRAHGQNVGIGIDTPLAKLHVSIGPSGNTTPFSPLVVEGNKNTYINLLTPSAN